MRDMTAANSSFALSSVSLLLETSRAYTFWRDFSMLQHQGNTITLHSNQRIIKSCTLRTAAFHCPHNATQRAVHLHIRVTFMVCYCTLLRLACCCILLHSLICFHGAAQIIQGYKRLYKYRTFIQQYNILHKNKTYYTQL